MEKKKLTMKQWKDNPQLKEKNQPQVKKKKANQLKKEKKV